MLLLLRQALLSTFVGTELFTLIRPLAQGALIGEHYSHYRTEQERRRRFANKVGENPSQVNLRE